MEKTNKGIAVARDILLVITFCITIANIVLMIVERASALKHYGGYVKIKDSDELPF